MPSPSSWSVLHIDDDDDVLGLVKEIVESLPAIADRGFQVDSSTSFEDGVSQLQEGNYDVVVLDVRAGNVEANVEPEEEAGRQLLARIQAIQFIPIVFFTGLPGVVEDLEAAPLIQVVQKGESLELLQSAVSGAISSGLPSLRRALRQHLSDVLRDYMWKFVAPHHDTFADNPDQAGYLYLLLRRLSRSITGVVSKQVGREVGLDLATEVEGGLVPPMRYYVMPPVEATTHHTGDIYRADLSEYAPKPPFGRAAGAADEGEAVDLTGFWLLITPICDLTIHGGKCKADNVILAHADRLDAQKEYTEWKANQSKTKRGLLERLLKNNRSGGQPDRFHYLPGAFDLPHLIVDFQQILSVPREALSAHDVVRVATLDEPYGAELISRFTNYLNRIGSPDLDIDEVLNGL